MLLNSFFTISEINKGIEKTIIDVEINKHNAVFEGHFPGNHVVPGVFLIQMIKETIEFIEQKKFMLEKSDEIKFINMILPEQISVLNLEIRQNIKSENQFAYNIIITDGKVVFFKMKVYMVINR